MALSNQAFRPLFEGKTELHVTDIMAWLHRRFGWFQGNSAQPELINVQPKFNSTRALI